MRNTSTLKNVWLLCLGLVLSISVNAQRPPTAVSASRCGSGTVTLVARGLAGNAIYRWFATATSTTPLLSGSDSTFVTPVLSDNRTYWVAIDSAGSLTSRVPVTATITAAPKELAAQGAAAVPRNYFLNLPLNGTLQELSNPGNPVQPSMATPPMVYGVGPDGLPNTAAFFNGTAGFGLNTTAGFASPQAFTISARFIARPGTTSRTIVAATGTASGGAQQGDRSLTIGPDGRLNFYLYAVTPQNFIPTQVVTDSLWHHVLISAQGGSHVRIYLDGRLVTSSSITEGFEAYTVFWKVGYNPRLGGGQPFIGGLSDVQIYNYALNPEQALAIANPGPVVSLSASSFCAGQAPQPVTFDVRQAENGILYRLWKGNAVIDSAVASGDSVVLRTDTVRALSSYLLQAVNQVTGCSRILDSVFTVAAGTLPDTLANSQTITCNSGNVTLSANPNTGETIRWYTSPTALVPVGEGATYTTRELRAFDTLNLYAARVVTATGCEGPRASYQVIVRRSPAQAPVLTAAPATDLTFNFGSRRDRGTLRNDAIVPVAVRDTTDRFGTAGSALAFFGNARVTTTRSINNPATFTLSIWARISSANLSGTQCLIAFNNTQNAAGSNHDRVLSVEGSGRLSFYTFGTNSGTLNTNRGIADDQWHHIVVRFSPAGSSIWIDGVESASSTTIRGAQAYTGWWRLGQRQDGNSYRGLLDDFVYLDRVISDAEVAQLRNARLTVGTGPTTFCAPGGASSVSISYPEPYVRYQLQQQSTGQLVGNAVLPTADTLNLPVPFVSATDTFNVVAVDTLTGCTRPVAAPIVMTVLPAPNAVVARDTNVCGNASTLLTARGAVGSDLYRWWLDSTTTAPITAGNPAQPVGTATLSITARTPGDSVVRWVSILSANGCTSARQRIVARWYANPTGITISPSGTQTVCSTDSLLLTAPAGFAGYLWSNGATTQTIFARTAGTYNVRVRTAQGCQASSGNVILQVSTTPGKPTVTLNGTQLTATFTGGTTGVTYRWFRNGVLTNRTTAVVNLVAPADTGNWQLVVARGNCVGDTSDAVYFQLVSLQTSQALQPLRLYPNPTNHSVRLAGISLGSVKLVQVVDLSGKLMMQVNGSDLAESLDVAALPAGMYQVLVHANDGTALRRLVKQ